MTPVTVALLGMLCWGLAPLFAKAGLRNITPLDGLLARSLVTLTLILTWAFTAGSFRRLGSLSPQEWALLGSEALLATLAGDLAYFAAIKHGSPGVIAVILSASPVITVWGAGLFLGDSFSPVQWWGTLLVVIGVLLVATGAGAR